MIRIIASGEGDPCYFVIYTFEMGTYLDDDSLALFWEELTHCSVVPLSFEPSTVSSQEGFGFNGDQPQSDVVWSYYARHRICIKEKRRDTRTMVDEIELNLWDLWCGWLDAPIVNLDLHQMLFVKRYHPQKIQWTL